MHRNSKYKLLKHIDYISATSIGALNSMKVLDNDIDGAIEIWIKDMNDEQNYCYYLFPYDTAIIEV